MTAEWIGDFRADISSIAERLKLEAGTFVKYDFADANSVMHTNFVLALNGLKYINTIVSPALRHWAPPHVQNLSEANAVLASGVGICGQQAEVYMALMDGVGVPSRLIQICTRTNGAIGSHVACEVFLEDKWRYIDVSFASVASLSPTDIYQLLSLEEIMSDTIEFHILRTAFDPWTNAWIKNFGDPVLGLRQADQMEVIIDGSGTLFIPFIDNVADFVGTPNFFGLHQRSLGREGNLSLAFFVPKGKSLEVTLGGASFYANEAGEYTIQDDTQTYFQGETKVNLGNFRVKGRDACVVFKMRARNFCSVEITSAKLV